MSTPQLQDIVGQDEAISQLQRTMQAERLPHAFLFAGPAGVGRRTTAIAFATTLLCQQTGGDAPFIQACGECDDCRMIAAGSHPDFQLVYKELARYHDDAAVRSRKMQELGIDVIRSFLIAPAGRSASRGRGKMFVVLEAELMSIAAQNALLKTLEEPPAGVTIILVCQDPDRLLPTTLSRCAMVRFGLLPSEFVVRGLVEAEVDQREASFWATFTEGSIGLALKLVEKGMYETKCEIIERLGTLPRAGDSQLAEDLAKTADKLAEADVAAAKKLDGAELSKLLASRRVSGTMLALIAGAYRDALAISAGSDRPLVFADQSKAIEAIAGRFSPVELAGIIDALARCEQLLWRNVNPKLVWDNVVITCSSGVAMSV